MIETIPQERIEAVGANAPASGGNGKAPGAAAHSDRPTGRIDVPAYCAEYGVKIREVKTEANRTIYILETCPFDENYGSKGETSIVQADGGLTTFHCKHTSCAGHTWQDVKNRVGKLEARHMGKPEPQTRPPTIPKALPPVAVGTWVRPTDRNNWGQVTADNGNSCEVHFVGSGGQADKEFPKSQLFTQDGRRLDDTDSEPRQFNVYSMADLDAMDLTVDMVIDRVLMFGAPAVDGGTFKVLKTSLALEQGLSMGIGPSTKWLDHFAVVRKAVSVYFAGEGGLVPLRDTLRRQAEHKGVALREVDGFFLCDEVPRLDSDADMQAATAILRERKAEFAYFDPCYLMMGAQAANASNVYAMGTMLGRMLRACREAGATPVILHHFNRAKGTAQNDAPDLADLSQAGCAEIAGQWGLLGRAKPFDPERPGEHDLILSIGSRMGYCSKWALHVSEGTPDDGGRYWQPTITPFSEARKEQQGQREQEREAKQQAKLNTNRQRICNVAAKFPAGEPMSIIRGRSGLRSDAFPAAWASLLDDGILVPVELRKSNHKKPYEGYRLRDSDTP